MEDNKVGAVIALVLLAVAAVTGFVCGAGSAAMLMFR